MMKRVFRLDVLKCAKCGSKRRWIAAITGREAIARGRGPVLVEALWIAYTLERSSLMPACTRGRSTASPCETLNPEPQESRPGSR